MLSKTGTGSLDGKIIEWENKKFIREKVCTFFYMPVNFAVS